jgi:hypothetical protein
MKQELLYRFLDKIILPTLVGMISIMVIIFLIVAWVAYKEFSYQVFYSNMVEQQIHQTVRPECIIPPEELR